MKDKVNHLSLFTLSSSKLLPLKTRTSTTVSNSLSTCSYISNNSSFRLFVIFLLTFCTFLLFLIYFGNHSTIKVKYSSFIDTKIENNRYGKIEEIDVNEVKQIVKQQMKTLKRLIKTGKGNIPTSDPLSLPSFSYLSDDIDKKTRNYGRYLNATFTNIKVNHLSEFKLSDIAMNTKTLDISSLFDIDNIVISGNYRLNNDIIRDKIRDQGKFNIEINKWTISMTGKFSQIINNTLELTSKRVKSYHQKSSIYYESSMNLQSKLEHHLFYKNDELSNTLIRKVREKIDDRINELLSLIFIENEEEDITMTFEELINQHRIKSSRTKRQVPCERGQDLDEYVDSLFRFASRVVRAMEPFSLPNVTVDLPEYNLKVFLHSGGATRGYTLQRKKPAWVHCSNESVSLGLTVGFEELRIKYKYRAIQDWNLLFDGEAEVMLRDPKLQVQFTQTTPDEESEEQVQQRVDRLRVWRIGRARVILSGLGNLTQAVGLIVSQFLNQNQDELEPSIRVFEKEAIGIINEMLKNISIPFFSII